MQKGEMFTENDDVVTNEGNIYCYLDAVDVTSPNYYTPEIQCRQPSVKTLTQSSTPTRAAVLKGSSVANCSQKKQKYVVEEDVSTDSDILGAINKILFDLNH
ncbi:unnamed protein product [Rotaria sp. Silwood1]|nr:unnamed protein product [Rotaria sp. Silwood1]CAF3881357.1 unnamed protein product [Rotaria sp. Silwood1]CAF4910480.1 unnamed protein product [Rotaria sp. Silwood1]CAF4954954.1 unnamed protein product [Rotaria sp. Silwood1]